MYEALLKRQEQFYEKQFGLLQQNLGGMAAKPLSMQVTRGLTKTRHTATLPCIRSLLGTAW